MSVRVFVRRTYESWLNDSFLSQEFHSPSSACHYLPTVFRLLAWYHHAKNLPGNKRPKTSLHCFLLKCPIVKWLYSPHIDANFHLVKLFVTDETSLHIAYTGWRRITRTIQSFNLVYENLHKIMPFTLLAHRHTRRQKRNVHSNILW